MCEWYGRWLSQLRHGGWRRAEWASGSPCDSRSGVRANLIFSIACAVLCGAFGGLSVSWAQTGMDQRGQAAADQVLQSVGTGDKLNANGMQPLATDKPMQTVDGTQQFNAKTSCRASKQFMRITILPDSSSDISTVTVDVDPTFTGAVTNSAVLTGPFAAVCNNGLVQCDANSFSNCHYKQWQANAAAQSIGLADVGPEQLGACYCFNNSCGNNLLWVNSAKVLNDLGSGIALELNKLWPRLSVGRSDQLDAVTLVYYGQNASCGADASPEQYYSHAQDLASAGAAAVMQPGTVANFMASTPAATGTSVGSLQCSINRNVALDEVTRDGIVSLLSMTRGQWLPSWQASVRPGCDPSNCIDFVVGDNSLHVYDSGSQSVCRVWTDSMLLNIARPDRVTSATLWKAQFDDYGQAWVGKTLAFTSAPQWTAAGGFPSSSCETSQDHFFGLNIDVTPEFTRSSGTLQVTSDTAVGGQGDGASYYEVRVNPGCQLGAETIANGCTAAENNKNCEVWEEWVDGVQTVRDGLTTGLGPLPSAKTLTGTTCSMSTGARNWWTTTRTYKCTSSTSPYDFSDVVQRRQTVTGSLDPSTGTYTDRVVNADGTVANPNGAVTLPPARPVSCQRTCKTRVPRPGDAVGLTGPQSTLNATGVAWTFNYKNCSSDGVCPLDPGEEVVSACDCQSNFAQAAAMMQTIRMVKEDQACAP